MLQQYLFLVAATGVSLMLQSNSSRCFIFAFFLCCSKFSSDVAVNFFVATDVFSNVALLVLEML